MHFELPVRLHWIEQIAVSPAVLEMAQEGQVAKPKVIVTRKWPTEVEAALTANYDVALNEQDRPLSTDELREALCSADAMLLTVTDRITAEILGVEPLRAKFLGSFGVGFEHIDIAAANARGITVTNTPDVLTQCTADLALTLLLMASRRAGEGERLVRRGDWAGWCPTQLMGVKVTGKTLGLIGMGRIARAVAERAHLGFGLKIIFCDPYSPPVEITTKLSAEQCSLQDVLANSDFVSMHCPGGKSTYHLIGAHELKQMKPGAILINTARGEVVNNRALLDALRNGDIAAAGLDVHEGEPLLDKDFFALENVVLLPHLGSATRETRIAMGNRVLQNLDAFFAGNRPHDKLE